MFAHSLVHAFTHSLTHSLALGCSGAFRRFASTAIYTVSGALEAVGAIVLLMSPCIKDGESDTFKILSIVMVSVCVLTWSRGMHVQTHARAHIHTHEHTHAHR